MNDENLPLSSDLSLNSSTSDRIAHALSVRSSRNSSLNRRRTSVWSGRTSVSVADASDNNSNSKQPSSSFRSSINSYDDRSNGLRKASIMLENQKRNRRTIDASQICITPSNDADCNDLPPTQPEGLMKGVIAFVEVWLGLENNTVLYQDKLRALGATVYKRFTNRVTHVVWNDGVQRTVERAVLWNIPLVSVLWIKHCQLHNRIVEVEPYSVLKNYELRNDDSDLSGIASGSGTPVIGRKRKPRSMQPKHLTVEEENAQANVRIKRRQKAKEKRDRERELLAVLEKSPHLQNASPVVHDGNSPEWWTPGELLRRRQKLAKLHHRMNEIINNGCDATTSVDPDCLSERIRKKLIASDSPVPKWLDKKCDEAESLRNWSLLSLNACSNDTSVHENERLDNSVNVDGCNLLCDDSIMSDSGGIAAPTNNGGGDVLVPCTPQSASQSFTNIVGARTSLGSADSLHLQLSTDDFSSQSPTKNLSLNEVEESFMSNLSRTSMKSPVCSLRDLAEKVQLRVSGDTSKSDGSIVSSGEQSRTKSRRSTRTELKKFHETVPQLKEHGLNVDVTLPHLAVGKSFTSLFEDTPPFLSVGESDSQEVVEQMIDCDERVDSPGSVVIETPPDDYEMMIEDDTNSESIPFTAMEPIVADSQSEIVLAVTNHPSVISESIESVVSDQDVVEDSGETTSSTEFKQPVRKIRKSPDVGVASPQQLGDHRDVEDVASLSLLEPTVFDDHLPAATSTDVVAKPTSKPAENDKIKSKIKHVKKHQPVIGKRRLYNLGQVTRSPPSQLPSPKYVSRINLINHRIKPKKNLISNNAVLASEKDEASVKEIEIVARRRSVRLDHNVAAATSKVSGTDQLLFKPAQVQPSPVNKLIIKKTPVRRSTRFKTPDKSLSINSSQLTTHVSDSDCLSTSMKSVTNVNMTKRKSFFTRSNLITDYEQEEIEPAVQPKTLRFTRKRMSILDPITTPDTATKRRRRTMMANGIEDVVVASTSSCVTPKKQTTTQFLKNDVKVRKMGSNFARGLVMTCLHTPQRELVQSAVSNMPSPKNALERRIKLVSDAKLNEATHVVCGEPYKRTLNVLYGLSRSCWLLSYDWVLRSIEQAKWVDEAEFELDDKFENCVIGRKEPKRVKSIFDGVGGIYIANRSDPPRADLTRLVKLCGGSISESPRRSRICVGQKTRCETSTSVTEKWILDSICALRRAPLDNYVIDD